MINSIAFKVQRSEYGRILGIRNLLDKSLMLNFAHILITDLYIARHIHLKTINLTFDCRWSIFIVSTCNGNFFDNASLRKLQKAIFVSKLDYWEKMYKFRR